jgi:hypothetical protein
MGDDKKKDVMEDLLSGKDDGEKFPEMDELNCLIYRTADDDVEAGLPEPEIDKSWELSRDNVTIQVWESKAKIRIKVSREARGTISIDRIANIAMDAIVEELKKEES